MKALQLVAWSTIPSSERCVSLNPDPIRSWFVSAEPVRAIRISI